MRPKSLHGLTQFSRPLQAKPLFSSGFPCHLKTMQEKGRGGGWKQKTGNTPPHVQFPQHRKSGRWATCDAVKQDEPA